MRATALCAAAALLSACATPTVERARQDQPFTKIYFAAQPDPVAECASDRLAMVSMNRLNQPTPTLASTGDGPSVVGRAGDGVVYVVDVRRHDAGSRARVYTSSQYLLHEENGEAVVSALYQCKKTLESD